MRAQERAEETWENELPCPKNGEPGLCPVLADEAGDGGKPEGESLRREVRGLLACRHFLWDVLLDGDWTGCARGHLRRLTARYGAEAVTRSFEE